MTSGDGSRGAVRPAATRWFCGVDVGASSTKVVLVDGEGAVRGRAVKPSGVDYAATARACLELAAAQAQIDPSAIVRTVSTGYGRRNVDFADHPVTEIHCHGLGCFDHVRRSCTIVDIGGQDNKVIHVDEGGRRQDFKMNRKCAAGTGAFIEEVALRLSLRIEQMEALAREGTEAAGLSSFCTVFAKTEILGHLRRGVPVGAIVRGAFESVVTRVLEMDPLLGDVVVTGGVVAFNPTVADILAARIHRDVTLPPEPQLTGALGAALLAQREDEERGAVNG